MSINMSTEVKGNQSPLLVSGEVRCALTGKVLQAQDAYWAPPLITARELIAAVWTNLVHTPSNLGHILFDEQTNVPYDPEARQLLASRITVEQLKLLGVLLLIAALIVVPILLLAM
jgi:hypothetical protein